MALDVKEWAQSHPYTALSIGAALIIMIGGFFVAVRVQDTPVREPRVWGGTGSPLINPSSYTPNPVLEVQNMLTSATDTPIGVYSSGQGATSQAQTFDYAALLAMISAPQSTTSSPSASTDTSLAYSFIPSGLVSISTQTKERTPMQSALYEYGNSAGSTIQSYEVLHRNDPQKLRDQAEDRQNPEKAETVRAIGRSMESLGQSLARMEDVPNEIKPNHEKLAQSYITIGKNLSKIPDAAGDEAFVVAIQTYNASVEVFIKNYVAIATTFSVHGVTFAQHDPGSVFVFTNTAL